MNSKYRATPERERNVAEDGGKPVKTKGAS